MIGNLRSARKSIAGLRLLHNRRYRDYKKNVGVFE